MEKHPATGSTVMEVTEGCTATCAGELLIPSAEAVMLALPARGLPPLSVPLQVMKFESHTPAQTNPLGAMVTSPVLDELKVKVVVTVPPEEFNAEGVIWATSPATMESVSGLSLTWATLGGAEVWLPPQPANMAANKTKILLFTTQDRMPPPRAGFPSG